jgi:hypothetical protein
LFSALIIFLISSKNFLSWTFNELTGK